jgi:hypothetical protein|tara:strand:+ start:2157 stop:2339 length:183 start_codon:yes stop_codon:yes gene_type:complete
MTDIIHIQNIHSFIGSVPDGYDLVEFEKGTEPDDGFLLYGFDEVGLSGLKPALVAHAFIK